MTVKVRPYKGDKTRKRWEVDIRFQWPNGDEYRERVKSPVSSKSGSEKWGEARERKLVADGPPDPEKERREKVPTFEAFLERFRRDHLVAERLKKSSKDSYEDLWRLYIVPLVGKKKLDAINNSDVQRLKANLSEHSISRLNNALSSLAVPLKKAVEWGVLTQMPCSIKLLKRPPTDAPFYEYEDYEALVAAAKKCGPRYELLILLGCDAGLRLGEVVALRQTSVNFDRNFLLVREAEWRGVLDVPKGGRSRKVEMTERLRAALKAYRHLRGERVLYAEGGEPLTERVVRNWVSTVERRAGKDVTGRFHIFRHTFCSHLAMRGAPAKAIQELAGHADLSTTMRYMHLSPAERGRAIRLLDQGRKADAERAAGHGEMLEKGA